MPWDLGDRYHILWIESFSTEPCFENDIRIDMFDFNTGKHRNWQTIEQNILNYV